MAGTIPLSMTQQFNEFGEPLSGGQLYIMQVGTVSTPQNAYQDTGLTVALPYPIVLDAAGRIPQFFLADGSVKIRLQDADGVVQLAADIVLVIGPSSGGGGGGATVDQTQLIKTGMMMFSHTTTAIDGFVRLNGRTIGSATSSATERANLDAQALFQFLWNDPNLTVSGGRTTALADWVSSKTIALPDWRDYALCGLSDMGNTAAGRQTSTYFGTSPIVLGAASTAAQSFQITNASLPPYTPSGNVALTMAGSVQLPFNSGLGYTSGGGTVAYQRSTPTVNDTVSVNFTGSSAAFNGTAVAGRTNTPFSVLGPRKLVTFYMKL